MAIAPRFLTWLSAIQSVHVSPRIQSMPPKAIFCFCLTPRTNLPLGVAIVVRIQHHCSFERLTWCECRRYAAIIFLVRSPIAVRIRLRATRCAHTWRSRNSAMVDRTVWILIFKVTTNAPRAIFVLLSKSRYWPRYASMTRNQDWERHCNNNVKDPRVHHHGKGLPWY